MDGYKEAAKIDGLIEQLLEDNFITPDNALDWLRFTRTIKTSLDILEETAKSVIDTQTEEIAESKSVSDGR